MHNGESVTVIGVVWVEESVSADILYCVVGSGVIVECESGKWREVW